MKRLLPAMMIFLLGWGSALAIDSGKPLPTVALQTRYETLIHQFRCLVCQNETIADSNADLAADLRHEVRNQLLAGKSDSEIRAYMVARYGDFVLFKPPVQSNTLALWLGPLAFVAVGGVVAAAVIRHRNRMALDAAEEADGAEGDERDPLT